MTVAGIPLIAFGFIVFSTTAFGASVALAKAETSRRMVIGRRIAGGVVVWGLLAGAQLLGLI